MSQATLDAFVKAIEAAVRAPRVYDGDGYETSLFRSFNGVERGRAEDTLIARAGQGDARALVTLGRLRVARALDVARSQAATAADAWVRLSAHRALARIGEPEDAVGLVAYATDPKPAVRKGALTDLAEVPGDAAAHALYGALDDPDAGVRSCALVGLLTRLGAAELRQDGAGKLLPQAPLSVVAALLGAAIEPLWRAGAWEARNVVAALSLGRRPDLLGLRYRPSAPQGFCAELAWALDAAGDAPLGVEAIAAVDGQDRRWAEVALAVALGPTPVGTLAARALGTLRAAWAAPAIAASGLGLDLDAPYAAVVAETLAALGG